MAYIGNTATTQAFTPAVDYFNGDNSTVAFTLSKPVASVAQVQAVIENVPQNPGSAYTVSGNTITFTSAPPSGTANIYVYYTSPITQVIAPSTSTVGNDQLQNDLTIEFADGSASTPSITNSGDTNTGIFFPAADTIAFAEGGAEAMRIDSSGQVGVNTTSPAFPVDINGGSTTGFTPGLRIKFTNSNNAGCIQLGNNPTGEGIVCGLRIAGDTGGGTTYDTYRNSGGSPFHAFLVNSTERMRIDSSGNLLVGTTNASNKFVVSGDTGGTAVAQIINSTSSGNVIAFATTLQSNGNNANSAHFQGSTAGVGNWYLFGNGTTSYSSDQRLKKNIETTRDGYLQDICRLRVVKYNWKIDSDETPKELGLIAQEVEQVFPSLVQDDLNPISQDDPTLYKQLKQSVLPFMLLKAIQELSAKNDALEARIAALENSNGN